MKAIAVHPGKADTVHLADVPEPTLNDIPAGREVRVRILRVGLDGTDKEINAGEYGAAPPGDDYLVIGHESFGVVEEVGDRVTEFAPGDYVVSRVRRPGTSVYDLIGMPDFTTDDVYHEHGISLVHGFLTERYFEDANQLVSVPRSLRDVGVLVEPTSVAEKGVTQAFDIQRRLKVWRPRRAAVLGAGTIGLLASMILRNRGLEVVTFGLDEPPYLNSDLVEALGAAYISTKQTSVTEAGEQLGRFDIVFEATGFSPIVFEAVRCLLGKNGAMVLSSVTGGKRHVDVPADALNLDFVLGNKVMFGTVNANREHFEEAVRDLAISEIERPGWLSRLITDRVDGLEAFQQAFEALEGKPGTIKVVVDIASEDA
jgi:threonine dehydrogenase-like Zn-dependent dehydrogenase